MRDPGLVNCLSPENFCPESFHSFVAGMELDKEHEKNLSLLWFDGEPKTVKLSAPRPKNSCSRGRTSIPGGDYASKYTNGSDIEVLLPFAAFMCFVTETSYG